MNKKRLSFLILTSFLIYNIASYNEVVLAKESNFENSTNTPIINGIKIKKQLIDMNYSKGVYITPKYIVIHDTDNRELGADAEANRNYFANHPNAKASAHYIVDEKNIVQALENNWKGWHIGDGNNKNINNSTTIGIELCVNKGNNFDKTLENGIELTKYLMNKYNISPENVVMHRHASGKICSKMMIEDRPGLWTYFKNRISNVSYNSNKKSNIGTVYGVNTNLSVRTGPKKNYNVIGYLLPKEKVEVLEEENGWVKIKFNTNSGSKVGYASKDYIKLN
ncbi:MAG: N-acetylmuramoyl-L-alanine amidase, partial [Clostridium perfringens]|nr:N-acetylmuramoyl-L-alanine amidase [Clostridium perfringens]